MEAISNSALTMLSYIAEKKMITSTELREAKIVTQHGFLPARKELLLGRFIKRIQDVHPRSNRGRRADIWAPTKKGLEYLGAEIPNNYVEDSAYNISTKRNISLVEKRNIDIDLSSGYCILLPELSVEPQELVESTSINISQLFLVERNKSTFEQIEKKWPGAKLWNGNLLEAIESFGPGSISYVHADLMSIFGEETINIIKSTNNKLTSDGAWIRLTNTSMSFRDNWALRQNFWSLVSETLIDIFGMGFLKFDEFKHYLLYSNKDILHSAWLNWSCLVQTHLPNNMAVMPKGVLHYRGNSVSTTMESCWFSIIPNDNPSLWVKESLLELTRLLNNANSNFYE